VFARSAIGPAADAICKDALMSINADGSDLRELVPPNAGLHMSSPSWSPDGSSILFDAATYVVRNATVASMYYDIYAVRPDGTGLRGITGDHISTWPFWTRDARIVFIRGMIDAGSGELSIMDADGANAAPLQITIPALTKAGCIVCPYAGDTNQYWVGTHLDVALWQSVRTRD
jgi:Tol biopolymer transport system component